MLREHRVAVWEPVIKIFYIYKKGQAGDYIIRHFRLSETV